MTKLAYLPPHLLRTVCLCHCKLSRGKLFKIAAPKAHASDPCQGILAILANLGSDGWQGLSLKLLDGYVVCLASKCIFERFVWERHSLTIVVLQLTYQFMLRQNSAQPCTVLQLITFP